MVMTGMCAALLAVLSQIQLPMPSGVPVTLQTFAAALSGYVLEMKFGAVATLVYILLGAAGLPVFAGFTGGVGIIAGATGGFIWGFPVLAALCGWAYQRGPAVRIGVSVLGIALCHLLGIFQFMAVMNMGFARSALIVSVPYLIKDGLSAAGAYFAARAVRRSLRH